MTMTEAFRALHLNGCFAMPNPWSRGSARSLVEMGFQALATTSAGHGRSIGKDDQEVTRDELVSHVRDLSSFVTVPVNVDSERLFPDAPGGIEATVELLAGAGAAGISIEDYNPVTRSIDALASATEAVARAVAAAAPFGLVVTARAENALYGVTDLDDSIDRLRAYRAEGADVVYAPGLRTEGDIARVLESVDAPLNVLALRQGPSMKDLARLGVRRVSSGSALYNAAMDAMRRAAERFL